MDISIAKPRTTLPKLIRAVEGQQVIITRHGKPVAQLAPAGLQVMRSQL